MHWLVLTSCRGRALGLTVWTRSLRGYFEKIRVFKAGLRLNISAWNNTIGLLSYFVGLGTGVMIKRNSWGHSYFNVRGEILGFFERRTSAKAFAKDVFINQERKLGARR